MHPIPRTEVVSGQDGVGEGVLSSRGNKSLVSLESLVALGTALGSPPLELLFQDVVHGGHVAKAARRWSVSPYGVNQQMCVHRFHDEDLRLQRDVAVCD